MLNSKIEPDNYFKLSLLVLALDTKERVFTCEKLLATSCSFGYVSNARISIERYIHILHILDNKEHAKSFLIFHEIISNVRPFLNDNYINYGYSKADKKKVFKNMERNIKQYNKDISIREIIENYKLIIKHSDTNYKFLERWWGVDKSFIDQILKYDASLRPKYSKYSSEIHSLSNVAIYEYHGENALIFQAFTDPIREDVEYCLYILGKTNKLLRNTIKFF